jgi:mono/diheme cytochrome c family protein
MSGAARWALGAVTCALLAGSGATAQEVDLAAGQNFYMTYCSQCHGRDARGNGPMAEMLAIATPDLTGLARANGGTFPTGEVAMKIDGRANVLAHGGEMPLFGPALEADQHMALRLENNQSLMASLPLAQLLGYLDSVQRE